jgi:hypothetical protein
MIRDWVLSKLEAHSDDERVIVRDPNRLLSEQDGTIHQFAKGNGFTVVVASTNLAFRDLYEQARADGPVPKLLLVDRSPQRRRRGAGQQSPPPLYPDLLSATNGTGVVELDLRDFLISKTNDPAWPQKVNEPAYARLISRHLNNVLAAHRNLRVSSDTRFSDHDFAEIVAYAAMGVPDAAFKKHKAEGLWQIGLSGYGVLSDLESIAPDVVQNVKEKLAKAPAPFCWLGKNDPDTVLRAFYTALILSQHTTEWKLLLANIDPSLAPFKDIDDSVLKSAPSDLIKLGEDQAHVDLSRTEQALSRDAIQLVLLDRLKIDTPDGFLGVLQRERFSSMFRELALLNALRDQLSGQPAHEHHRQIRDVLAPSVEIKKADAPFVDRRQSQSWSNLVQAYQYASRFMELRKELAAFVKTLGVRKPDQASYKLFWDHWNGKQINRCEYYLSTLERLADTAALLPREEAQLPSVFGNALADIKQRVSTLTADLNKQLDDINRRFQEMTAQQYPSWISGETDVYLTSQFIPRVLKPNWDPQTEKAVVLVFDGMRYDIFAELLRPQLTDRLEVLHDLQGSAVLPSETEVSRWCIAAGQPPADWWDNCRKGEDFHLKNALAREMNYTGKVEVLNPEGAATGETVRYRAGNLDYIIFEFCDKSLHHISVKTLPDNRQVPSRPLTQIYRQLLKDLIDNEVMSVIRQLAPGTKVFITADHGFGRIHRDRLQTEHAWLNQPEDCLHLNAWLRKTLKDCSPPDKFKQNVIEMPVTMLRMPTTEAAWDRNAKATLNKTYASILFPRTGYAFARPGRNFNPDAYSHGGISIQELMIPMVVMRVKQPDEGPLSLGQIDGPKELIEGEEAVFRLMLSRAGKTLFDDLRIDIEASVTGPVDAQDVNERELPHQVDFVSGAGATITQSYKFEQADATKGERVAGEAKRTLNIAVSCRDGHKPMRRSRTFPFVVKLNAEQVIRRVPPALGSIMGMMPKGMK